MKDHFHILLVEDNYGDVILAKEAFETLGIDEQLLVAKNGQDALELLTTLSSNESLPDLIIMDINMPIISGLELLQTIKNSDVYKLIPVVILTTSEAEKDIRQAYESNVNAYVVKPFDNDLFEELIKQIVDFWIHSVKTVKSTHHN